MLAESAHHKATLFATSRILQETVHKSLFRFTAPLSLAICNLHQILIHAFDGQGFRFSKCEALFLLGFESHVASVTIFVIYGFQSTVVQAADLSQGFGDC